MNLVVRDVTNPPEVRKEQSLLFNFQHMTQVVEEGLNRVAFRELDTFRFSTTFLSCWEANNNNSIAVGGSAGLSQDSVAIMMFTVMDT